MTLRSSTLIMGLLVAIGAGGGMLACSGSDEARSEGEETPAPPERQLSGTDPAPSQDTNAGPVPSADPAPSATTDGGATTKEGGGGGGTGTGGGTGGGGTGTKCDANAPVEKEGNDTEATANAVPAVTTSVCGTLSSKTDVDFFKFTLPEDTTSIAFGYNYSKAGLKIQVTVDGKSFAIGETPELIPGKEYVIKAFTTGDGPNAYRFSYTIGK